MEFPAITEKLVVCLPVFNLLFLITKILNILEAAILDT